MEGRIGGGGQSECHCEGLVWRTVDAAGSAIGLAVVVPVFMILRGGSAEVTGVRAVFVDKDETSAELNAGRLAGTTWRGSALFGEAVEPEIDGPATGCSSYAMDICFSFTCGLCEKRQFGREHDWLSGQGVLWKRPREENMDEAREQLRGLASGRVGLFFFYHDHGLQN